MYTCQYCGSQYENGKSYGAHLTNCQKNPNYQNIRFKRTTHKIQYNLNCEKCGNIYSVFETQNAISRGNYTRFCSRSCANSRKWTNQLKEKISNSLKNSQNHKIACKNMQVDKESKICPICKLQFQSLPWYNRIYCSSGCYKVYKNSQEGRLKLSNSISGNRHKEGYKTGGYRIGSVSTKHCWYQSPIAGKVHLDSSWELAYAKWLDQNKIKWVRNTDKFPYHYQDGSSHHYTPDFYLIQNDEYVQIKGYKTDKDQLKWKQFPHKLIILMQEQLKEMKIL